MLYISVAAKLFVATVEYKLCDYIVIDMCAQTGDPLFVKTVHFVSCNHSTDWYTVVKVSGQWSFVYIYIPQPSVH